MERCGKAPLFAPPAPPAPREVLRAPHPFTPPDAPPLISNDDYPVEAARKGWQGDVIADLVIDTLGRVRECTIFQSSGHAVLDQATCTILRRRAHFTPATDAKGNLIEDKYRTNTIRWRL
ncbi:MAG: energy transducer TonB [Sphingomicrobium sp.]|nr:energy transducer TonB [Sphingomonadales bacterium]